MDAVDYVDEERKARKEDPAPPVAEDPVSGLIYAAIESTFDIVADVDQVADLVADRLATAGLTVVPVTAGDAARAEAAGYRKALEEIAGALVSDDESDPDALVEDAGALQAIARDALETAGRSSESAQQGPDV